MGQRLLSRSALLASAIACFVPPGIAFPSDLPEDVQTFLESYRLCEHFRGEHTGGASPERDREVNEKISEVCTTADDCLVRLRAKYEADSEISTFLKRFECVTRSPTCK